MERACRMAVKRYKLIQAQDTLTQLEKPTPLSLTIPFVCGHCRTNSITVDVDLNEEDRFEKQL